LIHNEAQVYAAGSEDMDTLTFNTPILYRHLTFSEAKKEPISEINLQLALEGLEMEMSQFIDLCILLGCDYLEPIKGIGPKSALKLVREYGGLKGVVEHLREKCALLSSIAFLAHDENRQAEKDEAATDKEDGKKKRGGIQVPVEWPWEEAKKVFEQPDVTPSDQIEVGPPPVWSSCQLVILTHSAAGMVRTGCRGTGRFPCEGEGVQVSVIRPPLTAYSRF
jgi:flap endonuclease-1